MQSPADALKRSPGTNSPMTGQIPLAPAGAPYTGSNMDDQFSAGFDPNSLDSTGFDPALFPPNFQTVTPQAFPDVNQVTANPSTQLVRRTNNNQLAARSPMMAQQQWISPTGGRAWEEVVGEEDELNQKAALAKKEAQAKRKQIPPFVLKLWSFLNEDKNTELIRWTDGGTAFTVLDEDEFARTLIPELFKHNNYASFVRQLNMYGFHKKVGLNANSMKAAEKKTKDPNVYWHEYFRQGREDLLWLIQKPQSKSSSNKRKRGQDGKEGDSDEDKQVSADMDHATLTKHQKHNADLVVMPKSEVAELRSEIQRLQQQQGLISKMISSLKEQNQQFYRQASDFQSLHDRHENSINAILTFLATFYNRSLEAGLDLTNMFGGQSVPQQHGTVVDMGDNDFGDANANTNQQLRKYRKPQLLLQSSPAGRSSSQQPRQVSTQPPSNRNSASPPSASPPSASRQPTASPQVKDMDSPSFLNNYPSDSGDMMSLINAANASTPQNTSSPAFDFSTALNHAQSANGSNPLTPQQRTNMLNLIANQQASSNNLPSGANNALVTPTPPPMPDLDQYAKHQEQLEMLTRLQKEQDDKVADLAGRIQPLSPNGSIPGLTNLDSLGNEPDFDFDAFLQSPFPSGAEAQGQEGEGLGFDFGDGEGDNVDLFADKSAGGAEEEEEEEEGPKVESVHSESDGLGGVT
ncbi:Heat shock factor protein [Sphaceloma murrayae]|uniref:Heat shock factor protein n=1 Tax=Sphaceloma murrayae TaxID=2082308 RepID=A0A2K1QKM9_9PEZI|nr:Heat shock factor protein [Sphaceloma murrayae]